MKSFSSSFLKKAIELTNEREQHILLVHPEMKKHLVKFQNILEAPDEIRRSRIDPQTLLFYKRFGSMKVQKFLVVVIKTATQRNFIITSYITDKIKIGRKYEKN